jgi:hypothetical protein
MFGENCEKMTPSLFVRHATSDRRFEIRVRPEDGHKALHARDSFEPGDTLLAFSARATLNEPTVHSIQISETEHILLEPEFLAYTNHSCSPNVIFDLDRMAVIAIEPIGPGDEIVYFYPSTEASMKQPFFCGCLSPQCLGFIEGAGRLPAEVLERYHLADHIRSLLPVRELAS